MHDVFKLTRDLTPDEFPWLTEIKPKGLEVYGDRGQKYGHLITVCQKITFSDKDALNTHTSFTTPFDVPRDAVEYKFRV